MLLIWREGKRMRMTLGRSRMWEVGTDGWALAEVSREEHGAST